LMPSSIRKFGIAYIKAEDGKPAYSRYTRLSPSAKSVIQVGLVLGEQVIDYHGLVAFLVNP